MIALALLVAVATPSEGRVVERIVAVVNDGVVLLSEVDSVLDDMMRAQPPPAGTDAEAWRAQHRQEIIDTLIAEKLLEQEVKKLRVDVTDQEVDRVVQATKDEHHLDDAKLKQALAQQGLTLPEYKEGLKKQLTKMKIVQLKVKSRVNINDQEVKTIAKQQKAQAKQGGVSRVRARHILFFVQPGEDGESQRQKALAVKQRLDAGEDFAKVAEEVSQDPSSSKRGGELGVFGRGEMVPEFENAAFDAPVGKVTDPVRSPFGWHLILVDERIAGDASTKEENLDALRDRLYAAEVEQQFLRYIDELKRDAYIEVR